MTKLWRERERERERERVCDKRWNQYTTGEMLENRPGPQIIMLFRAQ